MYGWMCQKMIKKHIQTSVKDEWMVEYISLHPRNISVSAYSEPFGAFFVY